MLAERIRNLFKNLFFWLPNGDDLERKPYAIAVWVALGLLILVAVNLGEESGEITTSNQLTSQFSLASRYALGNKHLLGWTVKAGAGYGNGMMNVEEANDKVITEIRSTITSETDRVSLAILLAEIYGADAALVYLVALKNQPGTSRWLKQEIELMSLIYYDESNWQPNDADRQHIKRQYRWLGELMLAQGQPWQEETREKIYAQSVKTALLILLMLFVFGLILLAGVILAIVMLVKIKQGTISLHTNRAVFGLMKGRIVLLETVICFLGLITLSSIVMKSLNGTFGLILYLLSCCTVFWPLTRGFQWSELKEVLGLASVAGFRREIGLGIIGYIGCVPLIAVGIVLTMMLANMTGEVPAHPIVYQFEGAGFLQKIKWLLLGAVFAPVVEELIFRGVFYHYLRQRHSFWISSLITGLIFAVIHPQGWIAVPVICSIGMSFALLRELRNSIIPPVTAHILNNSLILIFVWLLI